MEIPKFLIERYQFWKKNTFEDYKNIYHQASKTAQKPIAMIVTCCDSRILENTIFGGGIGDYFVHRNIANIVPSKNDKALNIQTLSAIEYALKVLKIPNLIILGHSNCGGVEYSYKTLKDNKNVNNFEYINKWISCLKYSYNKIPKDLSENEKIIFFEQESIKQSIRNLSEYEFINKLIYENKLNVIGLWYQIHSGLIKFLNNKNSFTNLD
tara:strand:+ start:10019 stop:10651 length:633 start_codon:yes stop_codon:yes gene_type:complete